MSTLGRLLNFVGVALLILWFLTRKKMIKEGTWKEQGGAGAYLWLIIAVAIIVTGFLIG